MCRGGGTLLESSIAHRTLLFASLQYTAVLLCKAEDNTAANKRKIWELEEGRADTASRREKLGRLQENGLR